MSDLDRTLLRSDGSLGSESAALLNDLLARGVLFTYATARSYSSSRRATAALDLTLPVITYGGTITADPNQGTPSDLRLLSSDTVHSVVRICNEQPGAEPILHTFEHGRDWLRWRPERATPGVAAFTSLRDGDPRLRPITRHDPVDCAAVFYVAILAPFALLEELRRALAGPLESTAHFLSEEPATPELGWLEFHSPEGTKAQAITRLMKTLDADRLVVFGDNHNDVPMFAIADQGYAVENAVPELKSIATAVIDHHDRDAVARWMCANAVALNDR